MKRDKFISMISQVTTAESIKGRHYDDIKVDEKFIIGVRRSTSKSFKINIENLYNAYIELDVVNTKTLKPYVNGVQSPVYAILMKANLI